MKLLIINTVIKTAFINSPILSRGVLPGPFCFLPGKLRHGPDILCGLQFLIILFQFGDAENKRSQKD